MSGEDDIANGYAILQVLTGLFAITATAIGIIEFNTLARQTLTESGFIMVLFLEAYFGFVATYLLGKKAVEVANQ